MSFSKAKLRRFNEIASDVPPPGAYNPKFDTTISGHIPERKRHHISTRSNSENNVHSTTTNTLPNYKSTSTISSSRYHTDETSQQINFTKQIREKDVEIEKLSTQIKTLLMTIATQDSFNQSLEFDLDRVEAELRNCKNELKQLHQFIRNEIAQIVLHKRRYEIIIKENNATIAALCQRLAENNTANPSEHKP